MGTLTSSLVVSLKDDVSGPAKKVAQALKSATDQVQALSKAGVSDRLGQQLTKLGLSAKDIDRVSKSWKDYAASSGLAARASDWTRAQAAQVRSWENATVAALRRVTREHQQFARSAAGASSVGPAGRMAGGMIGAAAGIAGGYKAKEFAKKSVDAAGSFDIGVRKQREFVDIPKDIQDRVLIPQAKRIGQDTQFSNLDVVKAQTKAMQGLPAEFVADLRAEVGAGIVEAVKNYALTMEADLEGSSEAVRTFLQTTSKDIGSKQKALTEATRAVNLMVKMAKLGGMNDEDVQQFMKFGAATGTAAGLSDTTMAALGAVGRRGGLRGDELGVFLRAISSKLVAPTSKGLDALTAAGINYNDFTKMPGGLSAGSLEDFSKRRLGKGFSASQRSRISDILEDSEIVASREKFVEQIAQIVEEGFGKTKSGKTKAQDAQKIAKMIGDFHKLSTESVDSEGLLNAIMTNPKMSIALLNALFTDKHGGKGAILASKWGEFAKNKSELDKVTEDPEFAKRKADEIMGGLGGSLERARGSVENFQLAIGQANERLLKFGLDKGGDTLDWLSNLPASFLQWGTGLSAGAGALATGTAARAVLERFGLVGAGSGAAGMTGGLALGGLAGFAMSDISTDVLKANKEAANALTANSMLGAMSGDAGFAAAILNAPEIAAQIKADADRAQAARDAEKEKRKVNFGDVSTAGGRSGATAAAFGLQMDDVWKKGAEGVKHLDVSAEATAAATKSMGSYKNTVTTELAGVDQIIQAAVQRWIGMLNFSARPTITPNISAPSGGGAAPAAPGKQTNLQEMRSKQQALFADYGVMETV